MRQHHILDETLPVVPNTNVAADPRRIDLTSQLRCNLTPLGRQRWTIAKIDIQVVIGRRKTLAHPFANAFIKTQLNRTHTQQTGPGPDTPHAIVKKPDPSPH